MNEPDQPINCLDEPNAFTAFVSVIDDSHHYPQDYHTCMWSGYKAVLQAPEGTNLEDFWPTYSLLRLRPQLLPTTGRPETSRAPLHLRRPADSVLLRSDRPPKSRHPERTTLPIEPHHTRGLAVLLTRIVRQARHTQPRVFRHPALSADPRSGSQRDGALDLMLSPSASFLPFA